MTFSGRTRQNAERHAERRYEQQYEVTERERATNKNLDKGNTAAVDNRLCLC